MHTHYLRSFLYTALGLVLSLLIYLIILPFVIIRKIVKWFKKKSYKYDATYSSKLTPHNINKV